MRPILLLLSLLLVLAGCSQASPTPTPAATDGVRIPLPEPMLEGEVSLEETLAARRSIRDYTGDALHLEEVSQLLWAAQGITSDWGGRTAPSAGALYPLEVYLVAGEVEGLASGVYKYDPEEHELSVVREGDVREELARVALGQGPVREAAIDIVIAAVYERTVRKYGDRAERYVHMEAGHAGQNVYLQATALGLGTVTIGAFQDVRVQEVMGMADDEAPLYIIPVSRKT